MTLCVLKKMENILLCFIPCECSFEISKLHSFFKRNVDHVLNRCNAASQHCFSRGRTTCSELFCCCHHISHIVPLVGLFRQGGNVRLPRAFFAISWGICGHQPRPAFITTLYHHISLPR